MLHLISPRRAYEACAQMLDELPWDDSNDGFDEYGYFIACMRPPEENLFSDPAISDHFLRIWGKQRPHTELPKPLSWAELPPKSLREAFECCLDFLKKELIEVWKTDIATVLALIGSEEEAKRSSDYFWHLFQLAMFNGLPTSSGVSLASLGISGTALPRSAALREVERLRYERVLILGGDVYNRHNDRIEVAYANWSTDSKPQEDRDTYLRSSWDASEAYIKNFPESAEAEVLFRIVVKERSETSHAVEKIRERGVSASAVGNAIQYGMSFATRAGTIGHYDFVNDVRVIVNSDTGRTVTVFRGGR
jgi:hypothetical protein